MNRIAWVITLCALIVGVGASPAGAMTVTTTPDPSVGVAPGQTLHVSIQFPQQCVLRNHLGTEIADGGVVDVIVMPNSASSQSDGVVVQDVALANPLTSPVEFDVTIPAATTFVNEQWIWSFVPDGASYGPGWDDIILRERRAGTTNQSCPGNPTDQVVSELFDVVPVAAAPLVPGGAAAPALVMLAVAGCWIWRRSSARPRRA